MNDQRAGAGLPDTGGFSAADDRVGAGIRPTRKLGALHRRRQRGRRVSVEKVVTQYAAKDSRESVTSVLTKTRALQATPTRRSAWPSGEYLALFDHDDLLAAQTPCMRRRPRLRSTRQMLVYTDEDKVTGGSCRSISSPISSRTYNPDLLCANNYICHLVVVKRSLAQKAWAACGSRLRRGPGSRFSCFRCTEAGGPDRPYSEGALSLAGPSEPPRRTTPASKTVRL